LSLRTNNERSLSISIYEVLQSFLQDGDEIEVFEGDYGTNKLFGGIIDSYSSKFITPLTEEYPLFQVDFSSSGYNLIAQRRVVSVSYTNTNVNTIVTGLCGTGFLKDENITIGFISEAQFLPVVDYEAKNKTISEILDELAASSGRVWYIDNSRRFFFVNPQGTSIAPYSLNTFNGTFTDFHNLSWSGGIENYCNRVIVNGEFADSPLVKQVQSEIDERKKESDGQGTGLYEIAIDDSNIKSLYQAGLVADNYLRTNAVPTGKLSFSTYTEGFKPNQRLNVQIEQITGFSKSPPYHPNVFTYLIEEVSMEVENDVITKYNISCTRRNSSNFSIQKNSDYKEYFKNIIKG
jgi:hypothetical protein